MTDKTSSDTEKKPGEKPPGELHYNPGNMAGKTVGVGEGDGRPKEGQPENDDKQESGRGERADRRNP